VDAISTHLLRPYTILPGTQNSLWIKRGLDLVVEFHLRVVVKIVRVGNLIHNSKMRSILAPASLCCIVDQGCNEPVGAAAGVRVFAIETAAFLVSYMACEMRSHLHNTYNMMHLPHPNDESANEVEASFLTAFPRDLVLSYTIVAAYFGNGREEQVGAIG
jgi:hypothetical protein